MDKLVSLLLQKESILTGQQDRLRLNQVYLESAVQHAKSSIQSSGDVQFLLSRPAMVSTLENKESYSLVLEPEAQFLPEFSEKEQKREVRRMTVILFLATKAGQLNFLSRPDFRWVPEENMANISTS